MSLKNFEASNGNVRFLEEARSKAVTAFIQGHTLEVRLTAAIIAVAAGYVHMSTVRRRVCHSTRARCIFSTVTGVDAKKRARTVEKLGFADIVFFHVLIAGGFICATIILFPLLPHLPDVHVKFRPALDGVPG